MKKNLTEVALILDRSGSMSGLEKDTIGGCNSMLEQQRKLDGECLITTVLFDNRYELLHDRVNLRAVKPITEKEYYVGTLPRCWMPSARRFTKSRRRRKIPSQSIARKK